MSPGSRAVGEARETAQFSGVPDSKVIKPTYCADIDLEIWPPSPQIVQGFFDSGGGDPLDCWFLGRFGPAAAGALVQQRLACWGATWRNAARFFLSVMTPSRVGTQISDYFETSVEHLSPAEDGAARDLMKNQRLRG